MRKRKLMTSDFLGAVTEIFVFPLILVSWIPRIISVSLPFSWSPWSWAPFNFYSDLVLDPSRSLYTSQTQTEAPICFSTIKSETLYSLLRIRCADHQTQFTSILGSSALSVSECVLLIPESLQAFTLPVPSQSCHFLDQRQKYSLRKTSPRTQVSVDGLTLFSSKVV